MTAFEFWPKPGPADRRLPRRWLAHLRAIIGGYFWLPCPVCGQMFGGHEAGPMQQDGKVVCPAHPPIWPDGVKVVAR